MSEIERCPGCKGRKTVHGLGMIEKKCTDCDGIGHVKKKEPEVFEMNPVEELNFELPARPKPKKPRAKKAKL